MDSFVSSKEEIWFLRVCHHVSKVVYFMLRASRREQKFCSATSSLAARRVSSFLCCHAEVQANVKLPFKTGKGGQVEKYTKQLKLLWKWRSTWYAFEVFKADRGRGLRTMKMMPGEGSHKPL